MTQAQAAKAKLSGIPQVHRLLESDAAQALLRAHGRRQVVAAVREVLDELRQRICAGQEDAAWEPEVFARALAQRLSRNQDRNQAQSLRPVINATGVVLHTNLGRAPLAAEAVAAIASVAAGYSNLEYALDSGERGSRHDHVQDLLCRLTGAQAALVVNNCAAAVLLCLMTHARDGEVLASRGELIEIGGAFRMPDVIAQSGARLVEVGTTNKTRRKDYEQAIGEHTRVLLKSHPSNYRVSGFTASVSRTELAELARDRQLVFFEDLGSGSLVDLRRYGLPHEPTVQECVRAGGIVSFSGDKLLGGPQAGILLGPGAQIDAMRRHPLMRALRMDKLSLAALEATLRLYLCPAPPELHIPVLGMLAQEPAVLLRRARSLLRALRGIGGLECRIEEGASLPGGGSLPDVTLPSPLVQFRQPGEPVQESARRLRAQSLPVIARLMDGWLALDLRTVRKDETPQLLAALRALAKA